MQKVLFSFHAAQRMSQRLNTNIRTDNEVNISSAFKLSKTYTDLNTNEQVESWYCTIPGQRIVLLIGARSRVVTTVMTQGNVVDAIYAKNYH